MNKLFQIVVLCYSAVCMAEDLPSGWFLTTADQYLDEDITYKKGIIPNSITADFNGDKIADKAWILTDKSKTKCGLFVSLGTKTSKHQIIQLDENKIEHHISVGITPMEPGKYETACGKGYWDCDNDEQPSLLLKNTGIDYYVFESANSVFFWSELDSKFNRVWLSD